MNDSFDLDYATECVEQKPYTQSMEREIFGKWCEVNDSITPVYVSRKEWEERSENNVSGNFEPKEGEEETILYIPEDINMWEMIQIVTAIDQDTFKDVPENMYDGVERIMDLADTFKKAGIYIQVNIKNIQEGKEIAEKISRKFFNYGLSLESKFKQDEEVVAGVELTEEEKRRLDKWLLGEKRYKRVMDRLGPNPTQEVIERERERHFRGYFKALSMKGYTESNEVTETTDNKYANLWNRFLRTLKRESKNKRLLPKDGPIRRIHANTEIGIRSATEMPRKELETSIYRRGQRRLKQIEDLDFETISEDLNLYKSLDIETLRKELEMVRSSGDIKSISKRELKIAKLVHKMVSSMRYRKGVDTPAEIDMYKAINCVGGSLIGGNILSELGIQYFVVDLPNHSATILVTSDKKMYWQDFVNKNEQEDNYFEEITSDMIENPDSLGDFISEPNRFGIRVRLKDSEYALTPFGQLNFYLLEPGIGQNLQLLHNLSLEFFKESRYELGFSILRQALRLNPYYIRAYAELGRRYGEIGDYEEAQKFLEMGIRINPKDSNCYKRLGKILMDQDRGEESVEIYRMGIEQDPNDVHLYYGLGMALEKTGKRKEAISTYKKIVALGLGGDEFIGDLIVRIRELGGRF